MELTVLGSDGSWPGPGGAASGYLIRQAGFTVWTDLGTGTMANLQRHVGLLEVDAVVVSHMHADHFVDLFPYYYARVYGGPEPAPPLPLFVPPGATARIRGLLSDAGAGPFLACYQVTEVEPGNSFEAGPLHVRTAPMTHPVPTLGLRFEAEGESVAYSADTGPTDRLVELARGADVLLAEATWQEDGTAYPPDLHLTARQAGEHARRAEVRSLILTHIQPSLVRERSLEEAAAEFEREVALAEMGSTRTVGA